MSRNIQVSLPSEQAERILPKVQNMNGLIGLRIHKNISIQPKGDVLDFDLINSEVTNFLSFLEQEGLLNNEKVSITTNKPTNVISKSHSQKILSEVHESSWEDMLKNLLHESNMTLNTQLVMFFAGLMASIGISSNALHLVIGGMLIAPGFEPISRFVMGLITKHRDWKNGGMDVLKGYTVLIVGGFVGSLLIALVGKDVLPGSSSYLSTGALVEYWTTISAGSLLVSVFASLAGGIIILTNKSLLTAGVMVALALIPSATLIGMGIYQGNFELVGTALFRLLLEIAIVTIFTGAIFLWKKQTSHSRNMQM